jgi:hypothetical protein
LGKLLWVATLLSEQSTSNDMVTGEVTTARGLRDKLGKPVILPVSVNLPFDDPLNFELRSLLLTIQQQQGTLRLLANQLFQSGTSID